MKSDKEILIEAARLINERGLAKGSFLDQENRCCTIGAVRLAIGDGISPWSLNTMELTKGDDIEKKIKLLLGVHSVAVWNDDPERTVDEVADALLRAATAEG